MSLIMLLAAAAADPSAVVAVNACLAAATATRHACDGRWQSVRYRLDADLKGTLRTDDQGRSTTWRVDCPYDVVHRSGACAIVTNGVILLRTYRGRMAIVWGDRNAERRERMIRFDGTRDATWTNDMSAEDTTRVLALLEQSRRATFSWRPARAKVMAATTISLAGFAEVEALLAAIVEAARRAHDPG